MCLSLLTELQYNNAPLNCKLHVFSMCAGLNGVQFKRLFGRCIMYVFPYFQAASHSLISVDCFCCIKEFNSHRTLTIIKLCCLKKCKTTEFFCSVHSFHSLSFDKSIALSKTSCPWRAIWCFLIQFPVSVFPYGHPAAACFFLFFFIFPLCLSLCLSFLQ